MTNKPNSYFNPSRRGSWKASAKRGFALIVTLSLMILLVIVAVGLLGLSAVSMRTSSQFLAKAQAESNARLALQLAIGELQRTMGQDMAASATADSISKNATNPHLVGAWKSWHWMPTPGGAPSYSDKEGRFDSWLVSGPIKETDTLAYMDKAVSGTKTAINLVGDPDNQEKDTQGVSTLVMAEKVKTPGSSMKGSYAWAVFDESLKASIDIGEPENPLGTGQEIASRSAPYRMRADAISKTELESLREPVNLATLDTAKIKASSAPIRTRFHHFTTGTMGLLTDTANGGPKVDLTQLFEPGTLPNGVLPSPTVYPSTFPSASGSLLWAYFRDHYRKYKTVTAATGAAAYSPKSPDLQITPSGLNTAPTTERLLPAIARLQIIFSLVSHHAHIGDRMQGLNTQGVPLGNTNHAVVHLAYDPVITLYNPYDVSLDLTKLRIRIWDPPVGFRFTKIDNGTGSRVPFRSGSEFLGMARYQIKSEKDTNARKCFTLVLSDGTQAASAATLKLKPGEVKVFSPRVESNWSWGMEVSTGEYAPRSFFDWRQESNFGNIDNRTASGIGQWGVECVPGWVTKAGLQTDHLSYAGREAATLYPFEVGKSWVGGFVSLRLTDSVKVEARPTVTSGGSINHFQVDVLAGLNAPAAGSNVTSDLANSDVSPDRLRSYIFTFTSPTSATSSAKLGDDISQEIAANPTKSVVSREFLTSQILQAPNVTTVGGKKPFAMLDMTGRTTRDDLTDNKPYLYNNVVVEGGKQDTAQVGLSNQSYDLRFTEISSFANFPDGVSIDPATNRGYFGSTGGSSGSSFVQTYHVPLAPSASLGDLVHANLAPSSALPRVVHPLGNSRAHPLVPSNSVSQGSAMMDHSYLINDSLWDKYYFSSLTAYSGGVLPTRSFGDVLSGTIDGSNPGANARIQPVVSSSDPKSLADKIESLTPAQRALQISRYFGVRGPFNLNSTSVEAWVAVLSSLRDRNINGLSLKSPTAANGGTLAVTSYSSNDQTPFVRSSKPLAGSSETGAYRWAAFRALDDKQIRGLSEEIVKQIRARGEKDKAPPLTLGEFVNRRIGSSGDLHSLAGLLQTAIDNSDINDSVKGLDSKALNFSGTATKRRQGVKTPEVMNGNSVEGAPSMITQGDLMQGLAAVATVRGDTFKVRAYGEALAPDGKTVLASTWCEAVVQRIPQYVSSEDEPETATASLQATANKNFGRRFVVVSFRWLNRNEV